MKIDSTKTRRTLQVGPRSYDYFSVAAAEELGLVGVSRLPFSLKVVLENVLRQHAEGRSGGEDVGALAEWLEKRGSQREIGFRPARVDGKRCYDFRNEDSRHLDGGSQTMTHATTRRVWLRSLAAAVAATAIGTAVPVAAQQTLKFGLAMPLTGSQSSYGKDQIKAAEWAVADINAKGGVNGKKLEMIVLDTQADPTLGINAVNRLINVDKVPVFVTAWSAVVKAVAPIANREKVLELSIGANAPEISKLGDYVYTAFPLADVDVTALASYTFKTLGKKRVAIMYINNDTGVEAARVFRTVFEKSGGQIVAFEAYDPKATDYTGALLKVRAANPEMIHLHGLVADMPLVIAQMRQLGMNQRVTTYAGGYNPQMIEKAGKGAEGLIVTSLAPNEKQNPNVGPYIERWKKAENRIPNGLPYTQYLHDAPYLVAALYGYIEKNKLPATGENMRKALLAVRTFALPMTGKLTVNDDHTVQMPVNLLTVENGQFVPLATIN